MADDEEEFVKRALARAKRAEELEPRLAQLMVNALYEHLRSIGKLPAPGDKNFLLEFHLPPEIGKAADWSFVFDFVIPDNAGYISFFVAQFGRGIDVDKINLTLPPKDFEIPDDAKATAHHDAFNDLIERLTEILESKGFQDKHFSFPGDYLASDIIEISVNDPRIFRRSIATALQKTLLKTKFPFVLSMRAEFGGKKVRDGQHLLIVRKDRIAPDWDTALLKKVTRGKFTWP